jgi:AcrR family transcriptional regulator
MFRNGVAGTTMEDVKAAAGASSSQVYHYFADKQALVLAVIEFQTDAIVGGQEWLWDRLDTVEGLRSWRDHAIRLQRERECHGGCAIASLGSELAETDEVARAACAAGFARIEAGIREGLQAMSARGELAGDPDELAVTMLAAIQGGLLLSQVRRDTQPLATALDTMIAHIESLSTAPAGKARS